MPWHFGEHRLNGSPEKYLCQKPNLFIKKKTCSDPMSADPTCPFPTAVRVRPLPLWAWTFSSAMSVVPMLRYRLGSSRITHMMQCNVGNIMQCNNSIIYIYIYIYRERERDIITNNINTLQCNMRQGRSPRRARRAGKAMHQGLRRGSLGGSAPGLHHKTPA